MAKESEVILWNDIIATASSRVILLNMLRDDTGLAGKDGYTLNLDVHGNLYLYGAGDGYDTLRYDEPKFEFEHTILSIHESELFDEMDVSRYAMFFEGMDASLSNVMRGVITRCFGAFGNVRSLEISGNMPYVQLAYCVEQQKLVYFKSNQHWVSKYIELLEANW